MEIIFFKWADAENTKCEGVSSVVLYSEWSPSQCLAVWSISGRAIQIYTKNVFKHFLQGSYLKAPACDTPLCLFPTFIVLLSKMAVMSLSVHGWLVPSVSDGYQLPMFLCLIVCLMHTFDVPTTKTLGTYYIKKFLETHFPTHSQVGLVLLTPELGMAVEASACWLLSFRFFGDKLVFQFVILIYLDHPPIQLLRLDPEMKKTTISLWCCNAQSEQTQDHRQSSLEFFPLWLVPAMALESIA